MGGKGGGGGGAEGGGGLLKNAAIQLTAGGSAGRFNLPLVSYFVFLLHGKLGASMKRFDFPSALYCLNTQPLLLLGLLVSFKALLVSHLSDMSHMLEHA